MLTLEFDDSAEENRAERNVTPHFDPPAAARRAPLTCDTKGITGAHIGTMARLLQRNMHEHATN
jgi:hypothetical protein